MVGGSGFRPRLRRKSRLNLRQAQVSKPLPQSKIALWIYEVSFFNLTGRCSGQWHRLYDTLDRNIEKIERRTSNVQHRTSNIEYAALYRFLIKRNQS
jgi:hypothetical protein